MKIPDNRFQVLQQEYKGIPAHLLLDNLTGGHAVILPSTGGAVNQLALPVEGRSFELLDGYTSQTDLNDNLGITFKGCNLFPFPNRVADGSYTSNGETYQLDLNFQFENNAIHGLVFDQDFEVAGSNDGAENCTLTLRYTPAKRRSGYPFDYRLEHDFLLSADHGFTCTTRITNRSSAEIPIGHGWHPYFTVGADTIDNLLLCFPAREIIGVDSRNIPTGKNSTYRFFTEPRKIGDTSLDSCFRLDVGTGSCTETVLFNPQIDSGLRIWQETGSGKYNFLQIYTPKQRHAIAIEPMTCEPDAFNSKRGLISLAASQTISLSWGIAPITGSQFGHIIGR